MSSDPRVAVTGAAGHLGRAVVAALAARGAEPVGLSSTPGEGRRPYRLDDPVATDLISGLDAVVHTAWDQRAADPIARNLEGTRRLAAAAGAAGVRLVFVSSLAAYPGTRSAYGRTKLAAEEAVRRAGGASVRPGLIYGAHAGGMFGALRDLALRTPVLPVLRSPGRLQLVHQADLADLLADVALADRTPEGPVAAAHPAALPLPDVLRTTAAAAGRSVRLVPVPWRWAWLGLRAVERAGLRPPFASDSVLSIARAPVADVDPAVSGRLRAFGPDTALAAT